MVTGWVGLGGVSSDLFAFTWILLIDLDYLCQKYDATRFNVAKLMPHVNRSLTQADHAATE